MVKNANPVLPPARAILPDLISHWAVVAIAASALAFAGCTRESGAGSATAAATAPKTVADFFPIKVGGKVVRMQLAVRSDEMQHGLMERRDLGRDDGMIFVYERPQQMNFWMHNTPTALDIGFFGSGGVLEEVYPMFPFDETTVASHGTQLQFALEMNQGWFRANDVKPGAQIDTKALAAALKARGFDGKKYGLAE